MKGILLELFTSQTCPHCPAAKELVGRVVKSMSNALLIERDISEPENRERAAELGIGAVPTLVINSKHLVVGVPKSEDELLKVIYKEIPDLNRI